MLLYKHYVSGMEIFMQKLTVHDNANVVRPVPVVSSFEVHGS